MSLLTWLLGRKEEERRSRPVYATATWDIDSEGVWISRRVVRSNEVGIGASWEVAEVGGVFSLIGAGMGEDGYAFPDVESAGTALQCVEQVVREMEKRRLKSPHEAKELADRERKGVTGPVEWCPHEPKYWNQMCLSCWTEEAGAALSEVGRLREQIKGLVICCAATEIRLQKETKRLAVCLAANRREGEGYQARRQLDYEIKIKNEKRGRKKNGEKINEGERQKTKEEKQDDSNPTG